MFRELTTHFEQSELNGAGPCDQALGTCASEQSKNKSFDFPSTRYYGSKKRQLHWLRDEFIRFKGVTVLDAFGGTGSVSQLWRSLGWAVTYNDVFSFNHISARVIFSDVTRKYSENFLKEFLGKVDPSIGFISRKFEGLYFLSEENQWLDGLLLKLQGREESLQHLVLHCLFQACLQKRPFNLFHRANLNLRLFRGEVKFGNQTTWEKPFAQLMLQTYRELARIQCSTMHLPIKVLPPGPADQVQGKYDVIYIDPPYFHRSRTTESYLQRYHFLEGIARHSEWAQIIDPKSPIGQIKSGIVPEWSSKSSFQENLIKLIEKYNKNQVILSYVSDGFPAEEDLLRIFRANFGDVRISRNQYSRALSKKRVFEILISGQS